MADQTETREIAARRAYDAWRWHYDHVTRWNELSPGAQVLWLNVADAALAATQPEPDWADLGEMARNVGWSPERWVPGQVHWGRRNPNGFIEHRHGWARVRRLRTLGHVVIDLYGPAPHEDLSSTARLVDPTPARVLAIARELGIGAS